MLVELLLYGTRCDGFWIVDEKIRDFQKSHTNSIFPIAAKQHSMHSGIDHGHLVVIITITTYILGKTNAFLLNYSRKCFYLLLLVVLASSMKFFTTCHSRECILLLLVVSLPLVFPDNVSFPTIAPTIAPSIAPTMERHSNTTSKPSVVPTETPTSAPTIERHSNSTSKPSVVPTENQPDSLASPHPTVIPTKSPTKTPTQHSIPTKAPTNPPNSITFHPSTPSSSSSSSGRGTCAYYIESLSSFNQSVGPYPIECGTSLYGDRYGPKEYQLDSCCSGDGRYFVQEHGIGGFDYHGPEIHDATCLAFMDALTGVLCDPQQGRFISKARVNDTSISNKGYMFRICQSSCDAVFDACHEFLDYAGSVVSSGTDLCRELWGGGFGGETSCDKEPLGFPCKHDLQVAVILDDNNSNHLEEDCLPIMMPSKITIDHYETWGEAASACDELESEGSALVAIGVLLVLALCGCGCCVGCCFLFVRSTRGGGGGVIHSRRPSYAPTSNCDLPEGVPASDDRSIT